MAGIASMVLDFDGELANGLDMGLVAPDQTVEEAQSGIRGHALALLQVKDLIDSESWREAQKALRKNSAYVKQDIYTIIQGRPASERPQLRKLYFDLFNNVTKVSCAFLISYYLFIVNVMVIIRMLGFSLSINLVKLCIS